MKKPPAPKEIKTHIAIVHWLRTVAPHCIAHHSPNGEVRDKRTAANLKAMGVYPGWPDLTIITPIGRVVFLEIKRTGEKLSPSQVAFRDECLSRGIPFACVESVDQAREALTMWGVQTREAA
jgi:hypothetical protein